MKNYAKTIPKPHLDPKILLKEKISQAMNRQQQLSSSVTSHLDEEGNTVMDSITTINSYSNTPKRRNSYIPVPSKEKRKSKSGNKHKKDSRIQNAKYSEIELKRRDMALEESEKENSLNNMIAAGLPFSSTQSSHNTSLNSMEETLTTATDPTNNKLKNNDLVLPPISPTQFQLWNLEQEHRKAMSKVETIKKELNL